MAMIEHLDGDSPLYGLLGPLRIMSRDGEISVASSPTGPAP